MCGTPHYMSPELAQKKDYLGPAADIWALGVMLYIMITGKAPFNGDYEADLYRKIQQCKYSYPDDPSLKISSKVKKLISKMFNLDQ